MDKIKILIVLTIIFLAGSWMVYVMYNTIKSIPPDFKFGFELQALPLIVAMISLICLILLWKEPKEKVNYNEA